MNLPSIKTLALIFGDEAREARHILEMDRSELMTLPACIERARGCYHEPKTWDLRMHALDALGRFSGVEAFQLRDGDWCEYLNAGDTYAPTLLRVRGRYRVGCWGDIAEREAA